MIFRAGLRGLTALSLMLPLVSNQAAEARNDGMHPGQQGGRGIHVPHLTAAAAERRASDRYLPNISSANSRSQANDVLRNIRRSIDPHVDFGRAMTQIRLNNQLSAGLNSQNGTAGGARLQLDLSSSERSIVLTERMLGGKELNLTVGGAQRDYSVGEQVSAAEFVALTQVRRGDSQMLSLNGDGTASGGQFSLNFLKGPGSGNLLKGSGSPSVLGGLVIPEKVIAIDDVSRGAFRVSGDIVNYGEILGVASGAGSHSGRLVSENLINHSTGTISTDNRLSAGSAIDLLLRASSSLVNLGSIASSGSLILSSPEIRNSGSIKTVGSMLIETTRLANSGTIEALGSALQIVGTSSLSIENLGGTIEAARGNLAVSAINAIQINGGRLAAQSIKLCSPQSNVDVSVDSISGKVGVSAFASAVHVKEGDLALGDIDVLDDPIFTNSTGSILLPSLITASGGPVTAVAAKDILGAQGGTVINTASDTGNGGNVILLAGVANSTAGGTTTVGGASGFSGSISGISSITASGEKKSSGGNVTLGAFGGSISITGPIVTSGKNGGQVLIMGPGGISVGDVTSAGNHNTNQDYVVIRTSNPNLGSGLSFDSMGKLTSGTISSGPTIDFANITTGNIDAGNRDNSGYDGGGINLVAGGSVQTGFIRSMGGGGGPVGVRLFGYDYSNPGGAGGNVSIQAKGGGVTVDGDVNTSGGGGGGSNWSVGGKGGDGGDVLVTAVADVIFHGPVLAPGGGGGGGVGISSTDTGGGGGSLGNGGGPDSGGIFFAPPPYDGPAYLDNGLNPHNPNHPPFPYAGEGGSNTAYDIGCCGSGYGGDVGDYGQNGGQGTFLPRGWWNDSSPHPGGAPGLGGNINVTGRDVLVSETIGSFYDKKNIDKSPYAGFSMFTHSERGGGSIVINVASGTTSNTQYAANSDLESNIANLVASLRSGQLTLAGKLRGDTVSLNGTMLDKNVAPGTYQGSGTPQLTLVENGANKTINNGTAVTPAEWIALIQKSSTGSQALQLAAGGAANGGSFDINTANLPASGFTSLVIPVNVLASARTQLINAVNAVVKGSLDFQSSGALSTGKLNLSGALRAVGAGSALTLNASQVILSAGSLISGDAGIAINGAGSGLNISTAAGAASTITSTNGVIALSGGGNPIQFTNSTGSGTATVDFKGGAVNSSASNFTVGTGMSLTSDRDFSVNLSGGQFTNQGAIAVTAKDGSGGVFSVHGSGNLTVTPGNVSVLAGAPGGGKGGTIDFAAQNGTLTLVTGNLNASAIGSGDFDGGSILLSGKSISATTAGGLSLSANATGKGNGGIVSVLADGSGSDLTIGNGTGKISISATGGSAASTAGDGGHVAVSAGRNLIVDMSSLLFGPKGTGGRGGEVSLLAGSAGGGTLQVTGDVNASGVGIGSGGGVTLGSNSATTFRIGSPTVNGVSGEVLADSGSGGGAGGFLSISNTGSGGVTIDDSSDISGLAHGGAGGELQLLASNGTVSLEAGKYNFDGAGSAGAGGKILIAADKLSFVGGGTNLSANGSGTGGGGIVEVSVDGVGENLTLSSSQLSVSATGGSTGSNSGDGGTVRLSAAHDLVVGNKMMNAAALGNTGAGGNYVLTAGTGGSGKLSIDDTVNANAKGNAAGGDIDIKFADAGQFVIGGLGIANGVTGSLLADGATGGHISFENTISSPLQVVVNSTLSAGGANLGRISLLSANSDVSLQVNGVLNGILDADGNSMSVNQNSGDLVLGNIFAASSAQFFAAGNISSAAGSIINADQISLSSTNGAIGSLNSPIGLTTNSLSANAGGNGVYIESLGTGKLTVLDSSSGGAFVLEAHSSVDVNDIVTKNGDISVTTDSGKLYVVPGSQLLATDGDVNLRNDDIAAGKISIGANSFIKGSSTIAGLGDVYIGFGAPPAVLKRGKAKIKNCIVTKFDDKSKRVFVIKGKVTALDPDNTLTAEGRNIVFQNASKKKDRFITLEGNVTIIADPPSLGVPTTLSVEHQALPGQSILMTANQESLPGQSSLMSGNLVPLQDEKGTLAGAPTIVQLSTNPATTNLFAAELQVNLVPTRNALFTNVDSLAGTGTSNLQASEPFIVSDANTSRTGGMLLTPVADTEVDLNGAKLSVAGKAIVLVVSSPDGFSIYDLHDDRKQSVIVRMDGESVALAPGQHLSISKSRTLNFANVNPIETIHHRSLNHRTTRQGASMFTSEFSIPSAISSVESIRQLISSNDRQTKSLGDRMLKTASIILELRGGAYQEYARPAVSAYLP